MISNETYVALKENELLSEWEELVKTCHYNFEYGCHCNDLTLGELESNISFALDKFAKAAGLPLHDWDQDYEEVYCEKDTGED